MTFSFYLPTRIVSGENCLLENSGLLKEFGKKAFIMTGKSSAEKNGALQDMTKALTYEGIQWVHYNKVKPNPTLEEVRKVSEIAIETGADFIVALGGGSPMDAAKAVAVLAAGEVNDDQLLSLRKFDRVLPLIAVPTTAGTGSEVTPYSILTNTKLQTKSFLTTDQIYPKIAFLDGKYTMDLPPAITAATVVDAFSHAAEGYLAVRAIPMAQSLALESLKIIGPLLAALADRKKLTLEQRDSLLYASTLAGIVIAQSGTTAVHAMGYSLTYFKGLDHGVANGLLMAEYFRYIHTKRPDDVSTLLSAMNLVDINQLDELIRKLMGREKLDRNEIEKFASIAINAGNIANTDPRPSEEELTKILSLCFL